jgi:NAD(P)-dependent dehydrogenase (short-subunit alcohol dehydrogenase family)
MPLMDDLSGKVAVVTGGASGIGRALAERLVVEGASVVLADVERPALDDVAASLAVRHGAERVLAVPTDVRHAESVDALAEAVVDRFGAVHVLCNNAGVYQGGLSWTIPDDRWRWIVEVNLLGVVNGIRAFVPLIIEQGEGHIVNVSSAAGLLGGGPGLGAYAATKHAVVALSESLYLDLFATDADVGVSVLCPEWVRTRIVDSDRNAPGGPAPTGLPEVTEEMIRTLMVATVSAGLEPGDVADTVVAAIREKRFWVLTHDTTLPGARQRLERIESGTEPSLPSLW